MNEIFQSIITFLKRTAPISIIINVVAGAVLLVAGILLLVKNPEQIRGRKIGGWICVVLSILTFLGAVIDWISAYIIF